MDSNRRVLRVERELGQVLAQILHQGLKLPLPGIVSVIHVEVSRDTRQAKVYLRSSGSDQEVATVEKLLQEQRPQIQNQISRELQLRFCPVLHFFVQSTSGDSTEVDRLLAQLHARGSAVDGD